LKPTKLILHTTLFLVTFFTLTVAGVQWLNRDPFNLANFSLGIPYSVSVLFILGCHEFGHYFAARHHGVDATLPYFIPFPNLQSVVNFGTLGAVIRTKSPIPSRKVMFDIGAAGPIAGFVASMIVLVYGFSTLPGKEFILSIHPDYFSQPHPPTGIDLAFGNSILYEAFSALLTNPANQFVPPMTEVYHYPFLCAGWFGLFVTAMNMIPIGQLDGGHIAYTMFGSRHRFISRASFVTLLLIGAPVGGNPFLHRQARSPAGARRISPRRYETLAGLGHLRNPRSLVHPNSVHGDDLIRLTLRSFFLILIAYLHS